MKLRTVVFWMHLTPGVFAGTVVLIMSVTGVLLMYERQMVAWADSGLRSAPPSAEAPRLSADELVAKFRAERPQVTPGSLTIRSERDAPAAFAGAPGAPPVYVDQYSGAVLGDG